MKSEIILGYYNADLERQPWARPGRAAPVWQCGWRVSRAKPVHDRRAGHRLPKRCL